MRGAVRSAGTGRSRSSGYLTGSCDRGSGVKAPPRSVGGSRHSQDPFEGSVIFSVFAVLPIDPCIFIFRSRPLKSHFRLRPGCSGVVRFQRRPFPNVPPAAIKEFHQRSANKRYIRQLRAASPFVLPSKRLMNSRTIILYNSSFNLRSSTPVSMLGLSLISMTKIPRSFCLRSTP